MPTAASAPATAAVSSVTAPISVFSGLASDSASAMVAAVAAAPVAVPPTAGVDPRRDAGLLCVVETPADQAALERSGSYSGLYFVLLGRLSPLDGVGPEELGLGLLAARLAEGEVRELIIATNPTVEGEATAHYLSQLARDADVVPSRLAHGVPLGGELEYVDRSTLAHAFGSRKTAD